MLNCSLGSNNRKFYNNTIEFTTIWIHCFPIPGLTVPYIAETTLGYAGGVMVLTMLTMALMSTGSGEIMAISSIIVYDIYQIHVNPFRYATTVKGIYCFVDKISEPLIVIFNSHLLEHRAKIGLKNGTKVISFSFKMKFINYIYTTSISIMTMMKPSIPLSILQQKRALTT